MAKQAIKEEYEVGYCKPPVSSQWKPGQSGNPKGRKRRSRVTKSLPHYISDVLSEEVTVLDKGKPKNMPVGLALAKTLILGCINQKPKDILELLETLKKLDIFGLQENAVSDAEYQPIYTEEDRRLLEAIMLADDDDD